jgi:hypothetical protein
LSPTRGALQDRLLERAAAACVDVLLGEAAFGGRHLRNRLLQRAEPALAASEQAGFVEMDMRVDETRHHQPAVEPLLGRVAHQRRRQRGDQPVAHPDVDRLALAAGEAGRAQHEIERHGAPSTLPR